MQTNSDLIKNMGILAEEVYDNDNFLVGTPINADGTIYTVVATSADFGFSSGFQGMLLESDGKYIFAFRGTETESGVLELWRDLAITDIGNMGTGTAPQQMKDAMSFVHEMRNQYSGINATNTTFTGHSLGGSLASMASYVYGFDAYTYNGFGINNMLWDADDTGAVDHPNEMTPDEFGGWTDTYQTLGEHLESLGVTVQGTTNKTNNIIHVGYSRSDLVGGILTDIISGQIGDTHFVVNHTGDSGGGLDNHDKAKLNESIAVYNNILTLFPAQDYNSLTEILTPVSPEDQKIERFFTSLGEIVSAAPDNDHVTWSENISGTGITNLTLISLTDTSVASLQGQATDPAYLYALVNLNPFAITGADYSSLDLDVDNYSDQYLEDRSLFLYATTHENTDPIYYHDIERNIIVQAPSETTIISNYIFGTEGIDNLSGNAFGSGDDHLYGMGGSDTLNGYAGDDILEGGAGSDIMNGGADNDTFIINGTDEDVNAYDTFNGGTGDEDTILGSSGDDTIRVHNFIGDDTVEIIDGNGGANDIIAGTGMDDTIDLSATQLIGIDRIEGGSGNDALIGSSGIDHLLGGADNDTLEGGGGDDILEGGSGIDTYIINSGDGHDTIIDTGRNIIIKDDKTFTGMFTRIEGTDSYEFTSDDNSYTMTFNSPGHLEFDADTSLTFENQISAEDFSDNSFGFFLKDAPIVPVTEIIGTTEDNLLYDGPDTLRKVTGLDGNDMLIGSLGDDELNGEITMSEAA